MIEVDVTKKLHLAVDLDRTLARRTDNDLDINRIGEAIPAMIAHVKNWLAHGYKITIFTARLSHSPEENERQTNLIRTFLAREGLPQFSITAIKSHDFDYFIDDKAIPVTENMGLLEKSF